ncbi:MAG: methyltransferase protein [Paenibacillaceae bacterium]|nr:methyltransferase protein [Paenibacillaceae bacterium]
MGVNKLAEGVIAVFSGTIPDEINKILEMAKTQNFTMSCDVETGQLLRVLAGSKPNGVFLELGTGAGVSTAWILDGMDKSSKIISVEMDEAVQHIARACIDDERVQFVAMDGGTFIEENLEKQFDFIFADTWPGKYYLLKETLSMVKTGGFYIVDDLKPVDSWPAEHREKVKDLVETLEGLKDFHIVRLDWSTGLILATKGDAS